MTRQSKHALDNFRGNRLGCEVPYHATLQNNFGEFHVLFRFLAINYACAASFYSKKLAVSGFARKVAICSGLKVAIRLGSRPPSSGEGWPLRWSSTAPPPAGEMAKPRAGEPAGRVRPYHA